MNDELRTRLIAGLVGDRTDLYYNNATFYHTIQMLADMLPTWVDGIAAKAEITEARVRTELAWVKEQR